MDGNINGKTIYCHFSFRKPAGQKEYGRFAVAYIYNGKVIEHETVKLPLWDESQYVTYAQSYQAALDNIYRWQEHLERNNITKVILVTDNSTLAKWISGRVNKAYASDMEKAVKNYRAGAPKEIRVQVGLAYMDGEGRSRKYRKEEYVANDYEVAKVTYMREFEDKPFKVRNTNRDIEENISEVKEVEEETKEDEVSTQLDIEEDAFISVDELRGILEKESGIATTSGIYLE